MTANNGMNWLCEKISNHLIKLSEDEDILVAQKAKETLAEPEVEDSSDVDDWEDD